MNRRQETNEALRDWDEFYTTVALVNESVRAVLVRNRFGPTQKIKTPLLGHGVKGSQPPAYSDPTGDEAVELEDAEDRTSNEIRALADLIQRAKVTLEKLLDLNNTDPRRRAQRSIPNCMACNRLVYDRVKAGFCSTCYRRWLRHGRPDRLHFMEETLRKYNPVSTSASVAPVQAPVGDVGLD